MPAPSKPVRAPKKQKAAPHRSSVSAEAHGSKLGTRRASCKVDAQRRTEQATFSAKKKTSKVAPPKKLPPKVRSFFNDKETAAIESAVLNADIEFAAPTARFGEEFKLLVKQTGADSHKMDSDATTAAMYRATLAMVLDLIPIAEQQYRTKLSEQSAYALNALINQSVAISNLLRGFTDMQDRATHIVENIMIPTFIRMTQQLLAIGTGVQAEVDGLGLKAEQASAAKKAIAGMIRNYTMYLHDESKLTGDTVSSFLGVGAETTAGGVKLLAAPKKGAPAAKKTKPKTANLKEKRPSAKNGSSRQRRNDGDDVADPASLM